MNIHQQIISLLSNECSKNNIIVRKYYLIGSSLLDIRTSKDIDIIMIVADSERAYTTLASLSKIIKDATVQFEILISIYPINETTFINCSSMFLRNIREYGVEIMLNE